jgi:hypothetical protein
MLKKASSAETTSIIALLLAGQARKGSPDELAVNRVEQEIQHDLTPSLIDTARPHNLTHRTGGSWPPYPPPPASAGSGRSAVEPAQTGRSRFLKRRPLQELRFA